MAPCPSRDSTASVPPCCSTMSCASASPETGARLDPRDRSLRAVEVLEDVRQVLGRDPRAVVDDRDLDRARAGAVVDALGAPEDVPALGRELERVAEQVGEHLLERQRVEGGEQRLLGEMPLERDAFALGERRERLRQLGEERAQIAGHAFQPQLARFGARRRRAADRPGAAGARRCRARCAPDRVRPREARRARRGSRPIAAPGSA